jgi:hypothetical protein
VEKIAKNSMPDSAMNYAEKCKKCTVFALMKGCEKTRNFFEKIEKSA